MKKLHHAAKLTVENLNPTFAKLCAKTKQPRAHLIGLLDKIEENGLKVAPEDWQNLRAFLLKEDLETDTSRNKCPDDNGNYDRVYRPSVQGNRVDTSAADASTSNHNSFNERDTNVDMERMAETESVSFAMTLESDSSISVESDEKLISSLSSSDSDVTSGRNTLLRLKEAKDMNTMSQIIRQIESMFTLHPGIVSLINLTDENDRWSNLDSWNVDYDFDGGDDDFQFENKMNRFADVDNPEIDEKTEDNSRASVDEKNTMGQKQLFIDHVKSAYRKWRNRNKSFPSTFSHDIDFSHIYNTSRTEFFGGKPHLISSHSKLKESASDLKSTDFENKVAKKSGKVNESVEVLSEQCSSPSSDRGREGKGVTDDFEATSGSETCNDLLQNTLDPGHSEHPERVDIAKENYVAEPTGSKPDHAEALKAPDIDRDHLQKKISHTKSLNFEDAETSWTKIGRNGHTVRLAKSSDKQSVKPGYSISAIRVHQNEKLSDRDAVQKYLATHEIYEIFQMMLTSLIVEKPEKPIDFLINMARTMNQDIKIKKGMMTSVILNKAYRRMEKKSSH
ncbi:hypothetical protein PoB_001942400 [Plakobranchus ocellatus]|uniref:Uncharacterized protein n=1 Tax=Plakobranchus ocellatus TaxID=259542 RepID=A0AAV3ZGA0_9GAST|nr:hypothetical protein PoB_001942400 [Plakobranchus ocellatus]